MSNEVFLLPKPKFVKVHEESGLRLSRLLTIYHNKYKIKDISMLISSRMNKHLGYFADMFPIHDSFVKKELGDKYFFSCLVTEDTFSNRIKNTLNDELEERISNALSKLGALRKSLVAKNNCTTTEVLSQNFTDEGYIIDIRSESAFIIAESISGYYNGVQTFIQILDNAIFHHEDPETYIKIPKITVVDFPVLKLRAFHLDLKRMMHSFEYLKDLVEFIAKFKYNAVVVEYEDKFNYKGKLKAGRHKYHLNEKQFTEFMDICKFNQLQVIPLIQTFGHLERWLSKPEFHDYREISDEIIDSEKTHAICPLNPEAQDFIFKMVDQICEAHPDSPYVHIGADEVHELGNCKKCQEFVKNHSRSELYINWINKVAERVASHGKRAMLWSDYLIKYPEAIDSLHKNIIISYWDYAGSRPVEKYLWLDKLIFGSAITEQMNGNLLKYYKNYYDTDGFPDKVKLLPFYEFFKDKGLEVVGSPSVASAFKFMIPDYLQSIRNVAAQSSRVFETCSVGVFVTSWAECTNPFDTQLLEIATVSNSIWNPNDLISSSESKEKAVDKVQLEFKFDWKYLSKAASLNVFEMIPNQNYLDLSLISKATSIPRPDEEFDHDTHLDWIKQAQNHIKSKRSEVFERKSAIKGMLIGLETRSVQIEIYKIVSDLRERFKQFESDEDPEIFSNINLKEISNRLNSAVKFFETLQDEVIDHYIEKKIILEGETDFIFTRPKYKFVHLFKEHIPKMLELLPELVKRAAVLVNQSKSSGEEIDELAGYESFEDVLVELGTTLLFEIKA